MNDMSQVIIPKSDQMNADDLIAGPRTITIREVDIRPGTEQPVSIFFDGDNGKPWKTCKSMNRVLVSAWGPDAKAYVGRSVTIYRDPKVKWGGMAIGGIRISHLSHIAGNMELALTETKGKRAVTIIKPMVASEGTNAFTIDDARAELSAATSMDNLKKVWSLKAMAPFRSELQAELDARKMELSANDGTLAPDNPAATEGRGDEDYGDGHTDDEMITDEIVQAGQ